LKKNFLISLFLILFIPLLFSCGFHLQGARPLAPALHQVYIKTQNPYGLLVRYLKGFLKMSHVTVLSSPQDADVIIQILQEEESERLLSVSSSQQTRQYTLILSTTFDVTTRGGQVLVPPLTLRETRTLTIQSNEVLAGSNQASLFYEDMQRSLAYAMMNRLASEEVSAKLNHPIKPSLEPKS
jgi:LPS-assembly lipoprotein